MDIRTPEGNKSEIVEELHGIWEGICTTIGLRQGLSTEALFFSGCALESDDPHACQGYLARLAMS